MSEPQYRLEGIVHTRTEVREDFEGPLDVIFLLLSKNKIEIQDVSITAILEQYLAYLDEMKRLDMEIASEFITMASHLMLIKTKMLLSAAEQQEAEDELDLSILARIGSLISWIFIPLGWGEWQAAVASITGLVAKENIVGTMGILYGSGELTTWQALGQAFTSVTGYSFLVFNLLCAPCFAAIGAIKREMNNAKWTWFAIGYQCGFAYCVALMINQFGGLFTGNVNVLGLVAALVVLAGMIYMLFKPYKEATKLSKV